MSPTLEKQVKQAELGILEELFGSKNKVAELLSVDRSALTRWKQGESPDDENTIKLAGLNYLISILKMEYSYESMVHWFYGLNFHLQNQRPLDLIAAGRLNEVIQAAMQDVAGSYA